MAKPARILHIFGQMDRGGAQMRALDLMRRIDRDSYRFEFCVLSGLRGALDDEIRALGGRVHSCRLDAAFPVKFKRLLQSQRFDIVHSHVHHASGLLVRIASQANIPSRIVHFRSVSDGKPNTLRRHVQRAVMRRWIDRCATDILAVSGRAMSRSWRGTWQDDPRCRVIYNGIDVSQFAGESDRRGVRREFGLPADCPLVIHVGNMVKAKNHPRLLGIFAALLERHPACHLLLVGSRSPEIERQLRATAAGLAIGDRVHLAGVRADVPRLLLAADQMIFPSLWEGLPGAILEGAAAGLPVLASDIVEITEIAAHLPNVQTFPLRGSDQQWADASMCLWQSARPSRARLQEIFAASPFTVAVCLQAHRAVWDRGVRW